MYYEEKIKHCLAILKREKIMREWVFRNDAKKKEYKVREIDIVIDFINEISERLKDKQNKLF